MIKNLSIFIFERFFLSLVSLGKARYNISRSISFSLMIIDLKVVLKEFLGPTDLGRAQAFRIHELTKIIIVSNDKDFVSTASQVIVPSFKDFNNSKNFSLWVLYWVFMGIIF